MRRLGLLSAAVILMLSAVGPGVARGQTTTSTSPTTTTTTTSTTTTMTPTTTTALPNPCAGQPCAEDPPRALLSAASREIVADTGSYCWRGPSDPFTTCLALALDPNYTPPTLVVMQGQLVDVRFTAPVAIRPTEVVLTSGQTRIVLPASNPTSFRADLPPGTYRLVEGLTTRWLQGNVSYSLGLEVRAAAPPATPTPQGRVTLTG